MILKGQFKLRNSRNSTATMETSVTATQTPLHVQIIAAGEHGAIPTSLAGAIRDEGWQWCEWSDLATLDDLPRHVDVIILLFVVTFTMRSLEEIDHLTQDLGFPVIVYALEGHPMMMRAALEAGAEDFLSPEVPVIEIIARLQAFVRFRSRNREANRQPSDFYLDEATHTISLAGSGILRLTLPEYRLLRELLGARGRTVPRQRLDVLLAPFARSHTSKIVDHTVSRLRRKIGATRVLTVRGNGYRLVMHAANDGERAVPHGH